MKRVEKKKNRETVVVIALPQSVCIFLCTCTSLRSNFNDQFLMVWQCSGLYLFLFFSFHSLLLFRAAVAPLHAALLIPLHHRRRRALFFFFFFVHLYYFFSFRRHISAAGSGYVLFIDVLHGAVLFVFSSALSLPTISAAALLFIFFYASTTAAVTAVVGTYIIRCILSKNYRV